ncbi:hypothetical protein T08_14539 [Trichinella sp. T8]|nr:hypothetical protein T08_14539 [Trichinella sp. T8]
MSRKWKRKWIPLLLDTGFCHKCHNAKFNFAPCYV